MTILKNSWNYFLLLSLCIVCNALTPSTFLNDADQQRLKKVLSSAFPLSDLTTAYYATLGYSVLGEKPPTSEDVCKFFETKLDKRKVDTIYHSSSGSKLISNCKLPVSGLQQALDSVLVEDASMQDIYHAVLSLKNLNLKIDSPKISKILSAVLKRDDSVLNLGYAFHIASVLQGDLTPFFERIEDVIVQADEVDGKYLQFEGGLGITATTINGIYKLATAQTKAPALTPDQAIKFTNYFLSRKYVQTVKGSAQLLDILKIFTTNKFHIPVAITLASNGALSSENPNLQVRITNVLGEFFGPLTVTADNAKRIGEDSVVINKKTFQAVKGNKMLYSLNFMDIKPLRGFYSISVSAVPNKADPRLIGNSGAQINVKVMTEVAVEGTEIGTSFVGQVSSLKSTMINYPEDKVKLEVDNHQKIYMKFSLKDKIAGTSLVAHQTFVQFVNQKTGQEVVYVAEPNTLNTYRFDLDLSLKQVSEGVIPPSGVYDVFLIVGDPVLKNPLTWKLGQITISMPSITDAPSVSQNLYQPKPEIKHLFREKDKKPSSFVSNTFSALCIAPLFLLLSLWAKLRVNLSNFPCSLAAAGFHLGLLGIFALFICFWMHLDMFSTLNYLAGFGIFTYLTGHRLLSTVAAGK